MHVVNMLEAKSNLSRLVSALEQNREQEVIIARNGRPVARLLPVENDVCINHRIGVAKGHFTMPDDLDIDDQDIATLFNRA